MSRATLLAFCLCLAALAGCVSTSTQAPASETQNAAWSAGVPVFEKWCAPCHAAGPGHAGTMALAVRLGKDKAVLLDRTDLVAPYVKTVVRYGLQMMPPFKETEISDEELDAVAAYVARAGQ